MPENPPDSLDTVRPAADAGPAGDPVLAGDAARTDDPAPTEDPAPADAQTPAFGDRTPSRFAADVEYSGRAGAHDYLLRVRHRLLDTSFTMVIDGIEHDPKAEQKARAAEGSAEEEAGAEADGETDGDAAAAADGDGDTETDGDAEAGADADAAPSGGDGLRFRLEEGFATLHCTVRRPKDGGGFKDAEVLTIRTAGLGGAGEVDVRHGFQRTVLVPADDSPSAARDAKRTAHPTRYALVAALSKSARYLLPLLGLGALFSGLLDPVREWVVARVRPVLEAVARLTAPVREWIAELLRPIQEFLEMVFSPVREFLAALLRPVRDLLDWLRGLIPDIGLPFDVPGWVVEVMVPLIVVVAVFSATRKGLRDRREKLAATRAAGRDGTDEAPDQRGPSVAGPHAMDEALDAPEPTVAAPPARDRAEQEPGPSPPHDS